MDIHMDFGAHGPKLFAHGQGKGRGRVVKIVERPVVDKGGGGPKNGLEIAAPSLENLSRGRFTASRG
jgi:hypothetical protein